MGYGELADRLEKWCAAFYSKTGPCRDCHGNVQCLRCEAAAALRELDAENEELRDVMENLGIREGSAEARAALAKEGEGDE